MCATWIAPHYLQIAQISIDHPASSDFYKFYLSAKRNSHGDSMYWIIPPRDQSGEPCDTPAAPTKPSNQENRFLKPLTCLHPNLNPPIFTATIQPLTNLPYMTAWIIWEIISFTCLATGTWLLNSDPATPKHLKAIRAIGLSGILLLYFPIIANYTLGQMGTIMYAILCASWRCGRSKKALRAGIWLGIGIALKPFFAALLIPLVALKKKSTYISAVSTAILISLMGIYLYGFDTHLEYLNSIREITWATTNWNASWQGLIDRSFLGSQSPTSKYAANGLSLLAIATTITLGTWAIKDQNKNSERNQWDALMAIGLPMTLLASPLGWIYYFPLLIISIQIKIHQAKKPNHSSTPLMIMAFLLQEIPTTISKSNTWRNVDSLYWFSLIVFFAATLYLFKNPIKKLPDKMSGSFGSDA
jgi:hypothetical protein